MLNIQNLLLKRLNTLNFSIYDKLFLFKFQRLANGYFPIINVHPIRFNVPQYMKFFISNVPNIWIEKYLNKIAKYKSRINDRQPQICLLHRTNNESILIHSMSFSLNSGEMDILTQIQLLI